MKIVTVIGARPQFVKAAVVSRALRPMQNVQEVLVHTGQHYDLNMSDVFFTELQIPSADHHLGIGGGRHGAQTGRMLEAIEDVLLDHHPDWVMVYGDTNSTLAGALAAAKLHIPVAHVEAGLRSFNRRMPEEINRVVTDHAGDLLLCPTATAVANLRREGIPDARIRLTGDVMYDATLHYRARAEMESEIFKELGIVEDQYVLCTIHRAENTDDSGRLELIFASLTELAVDIEVVVPLHPRTRAALERNGSLTRFSRQLRLIQPVGYLDMLMLEKGARLVVTDSGGVQKEAFFLGVPCATVRGETEWVELVEAGWNRLVPPVDQESVTEALRHQLNWRAPSEPPLLYGRGDAGSRIAHLLANSDSTDYRPEP